MTFDTQPLPTWPWIKRVC